MIPVTYPSSVSTSKESQMVVFALSSIAGLRRWTDYIPVKYQYTGSDVPNSFNTNGYIACDFLASDTGKQAWVDYIPIFVDTNATTAWQVSDTGFIPFNTLAGGGSYGMFLDFTAANRLDPRITFSRTSNATLTDSTGKIAYAPHNLLTNSEDFEAAGWIKSATTITSNSTVAPDGTTTADKLVENTATSTHFVNQAFSALATTTYTCSAYLKAAENRYAQLWFGTINSGASFDLLSGTSSAVSGFNNPDSHSIVAVGNGWYRCSVTYTNPSAATAQASIYLSEDGNFANRSYTGDGTSGIFIWGAQLNVGALQSYNSTTPKNLLGFTQEFNNAAWTKSNATISANVVAAPDGYATADKLVENTTLNFHFTAPASVIATVSGTPSTLSVYMKAGERRYGGIHHQDGTAKGCSVDLLTGTLGTPYGGATAQLSSLGSGWYRLSVTATLVAANTPAIYVSDTNSLASYTGDGTSGIYIWGAQLSNSASVDPYVYNPQAAPTSTAYYGPRFDYNPVTLAANGLLIEEQRTNLLTYSEQFDNAAWTKSNVSVTANTTVSPDGSTNAEKIAASVATSVQHVVSQTAGSPSTLQTLSVYAKAAENAFLWISLFDSTNRITWFNLSTGVVGTNAAGSTASITNVGNGWYRCSISRTTDATLGPQAIIGFSNADNVAVYSDTIGNGIFIWGAQLEAGSFATSYIPTVASQVTRAADNASMLGDNFSTWYNQTQGTIYAQAVSAQPLNTPASVANGVVSINDNSSSNRIDLRLQSGGSSFVSFVSDAGVNQAVLINSGTYAPNTAYKSALAYSANDFARVTNGGTVATDTSGTVPSSLNKLSIGALDGGSVAFTNGTIRSISYYPTRLPNATLQSITT